MTSRSTRVTSAPSVAATVAHVFPAGPPPRIASRTPEMRVTHQGYGTPLASTAAGGGFADRCRKAGACDGENGD